MTIQIFEHRRITGLPAVPWSGLSLLRDRGLLLSRMGAYSDMMVRFLHKQTITMRYDIFFKGFLPRACAATPPVAPGPQHGSDEDEQEGHVGDPHDDGHGVQAQDGPGRGRGGRHGLGAAHLGAVLAGAGARAVVQALGAVERLVVHGLVAGHRHVWGHRSSTVRDTRTPHSSHQH